MSMPPSSGSPLANAASTSCGSPTSARWKTPPTDSATARPASSVRSTTPTRAPSSVSRSAVAAPMPEAAPVISATLPSSAATTAGYAGPHSTGRLRSRYVGGLAPSVGLPVGEGRGTSKTPRSWPSSRLALALEPPDEIGRHLVAVRLVEHLMARVLIADHGDVADAGIAVALRNELHERHRAAQR